MKRGLAYVLFGLAAYVLFLLIQLPAQQVYGRLTERYPLPVKLYQLKGSVWNGSAALVTWGPRRFENLHWRLRPQSLLLGRLEIAVELSKDRARIAAIAGRALNGGLYVRAGQAHLPLADVENLISRDPMGLTGTVELDLERLEIARGRITAAQGSLSIENAGLAPPLKVAIGNFRMDFATTEEGVIKGVISDNGGPLQAQGLLLLQPDGSYRLTAELAARDPQRRDIKQALRYLGTPSPAGKVSLVRTGRLPLERFLGQRKIEN